MISLTIDRKEKILVLKVTLSNRTFASSAICDVSAKKKTANIVKRKSEKRRREKKGIIVDTMLTHARVDYRMHRPIHHYNRSDY